MAINKRRRIRGSSASNPAMAGLDKLQKIEYWQQFSHKVTPVPSSGATPVKSAALVFCEEFHRAGGVNEDTKIIR